MVAHGADAALETDGSGLDSLKFFAGLDEIDLGLWRSF